MLGFQSLPKSSNISPNAHYTLNMMTWKSQILHHICHPALVLVLIPPYVCFLGIQTALKDASNFNAPIPVSSEDLISLWMQAA